MLVFRAPSAKFFLFQPPESRGARVAAGPFKISEEALEAGVGWQSLAVGHRVQSGEAKKAPIEVAPRG